MFNVPILFIIFNRPETTLKVFEAIKKIKPKQLFIAADGPRSDKEGEYDLCEQTRKIVNYIDWDCAVEKLYQNENLGCGLGVSGAITWFFKNVEAGIILEDDCLPNKSFFDFCEIILDQFKNNEQIMHISGSSFYNLNTKDSYYFSYYNYIWGWATWRRAWEKYNYELEDLDCFFEKKILEKNLYSKKEVDYFKNAFKEVKIRKHTWDYQWTYTIWKNNGISVNPYKNMVLNIGFGPDATHTKIVDAKYLNRQTEELNEIIHPSEISINQKRDYQIFKKEYIQRTSLANHLRNLSYAILPRSLRDYLKKIKS